MRIAPLLVLAALAACSGTPPPADWKMNAVSLLEHYQTRWLEGDGKSADLALDNTRQEIAKSGRIDLLARAELAACATRAAALDFSACSRFEPLKLEAAPQDLAYARFLAGDWNGLDAKLLPSHYAAVVGAGDAAAANRAAAEIKAPLPRLIAVALLFKTGRSAPQTIGVAVDTASERGWRRPLLVWLQVQLKRAEAAGDAQAIARLKQRLQLAGGSDADSGSISGSISGAASEPKTQATR